MKLILAVMLLLTFPLTVNAGNSLRILPPNGNFGAIRVGECDLVTYSGCTVKTFTIINTSDLPITIGGYGVESSSTNVALVPVDNECYNYNTLAPNASCNVGATLSPLTRGHVNVSLNIWGQDQSQVLVEISLSGVGL